MLTTRISLFFLVTFGLASEGYAAHTSRRPLTERTVNVSGFHGRIIIHDLPGDRVAIQTRSGHSISNDTIEGHGVFPLTVNGRKQWFYAGRFGTSKFPMLIFAVGDPRRAQDSKVLCYQLGPNGSLIGQQVVVDENLKHGHAEDISGGRYQLAAVDPSLGAIYSVSYQDAHFEGFYVAYEKLRVRQWDETINSFIEADQGFLRERNGKLVHSSQFYSLSDQKKEEIFLANLEVTKPHVAIRRAAPKVISASAQLGK